MEVFPLYKNPTAQTFNIDHRSNNESAPTIAIKITNIEDLAQICMRCHNCPSKPDKKPKFRQYIFVVHDLEGGSFFPALICKPTGSPRSCLKD